MSWGLLVWSAITVGRRNLLDVLQYGNYSLFEIVYRAALLYANLRAASNDTLVRSAAYNGLDPSEKSAVSYFLGMTMTKAFAELALDVPWLMHLDVYRRQLQPLTTRTRSRPDLVGQTNSSEWVVLESKGRTNGLNDQALQKAKQQAGNLTLISGQAPDLHVGVVTHFGDGRLQLVAADPPVDAHRRHLELRVTREELLESYYAPFRNLLSANETRETLHDDLTYRVVRIDAADVTVGLRENLAKGEIEMPKETTGRSSRGESYYAGTDGILVMLGTSWAPENMRKEPLARSRGK